MIKISNIDGVNRVDFIHLKSNEVVLILTDEDFSNFEPTKGEMVDYILVPKKYRHRFFETNQWLSLQSTLSTMDIHRVKFY